MQCRRCGFENMPGLTTCMRYNSVLTSTAPVDVHPPRAGWTRRVRPIQYVINTLFADYPGRISQRIDQALSKCFYGAQNVVWGILSIFPGLGHLLTGRLRAIRFYLLGWAGVLLVGLCFWGTPWGAPSTWFSRGPACLGYHGWRPDSPGL